MITFALLLISLLVIMIITAICIIAGGAGIILILGDLIVCGALIWLIVRLIRRKK